MNTVADSPCNDKGRTSSVESWHRIGMTFADVDTYMRTLQNRTNSFGESTGGEKACAGRCVPLCCDAQSLRQADISRLNDFTHHDMIADFAFMLERGIDWLIEPLKDLQPRSWAVLTKPETRLCVGIHAFDRIWETWTGNVHGFFFVQDRAIEIGAYGINDTFECGNDRFGYLLALPEVLSHSWMWRVKGWKIITQLPTSMYQQRGMIADPGWDQIDDVLNTYGKLHKKKYLPAFKERFPDLAHPKVKSKLLLRCFLDTRPEGMNGPVGDQFFVHAAHRDQIVYHIHQGDAGNLRIIPDEQVGEAFDRYHEHVLTRTLGEFDFMPYSRFA